MPQHQTVGVCVQKLLSAPTLESLKPGHEKHLPDVLHAICFHNNFQKWSWNRIGFVSRT
jgi:hypothetical protein